LKKEPVAKVKEKGQNKLFQAIEGRNGVKKNAGQTREMNAEKNFFNKGEQRERALREKSNCRWNRDRDMCCLSLARPFGSQSEERRKRLQRVHTAANIFQ